MSTRSREAVAADVMLCGCSHEATSRLIGNVTALELVRLAAPLITSCPKCGAEPWTNIDCELCAVGHALRKDIE